jgi:predicted MPP superfamily phosphohydrolase
MSGVAKGAAVAGVVAGLALHTLRHAPNDVRLENVRLPVPGMPAGSRPVEVLFLTDAHHWGWGIREERVIALLVGQPPPDLVVWGGDYLGALSGISTAVRFMRTVMAHFPGVPSVAVRGNAEHKIRPDERCALEQAIEDVGVHVLVNRNQRMQLAGMEWVVAGTDDPYYGFCDLGEALSGVQEGELTLLVSHSPQVALRAAGLGVDVQLSGHTHGGQVCLPGFGAVRTQNPLSRRIDRGVFDRPRLEQISGRRLTGHFVLYISRGLGVAFVPRLPWLAPRFFCPPEITRLTLFRPGDVDAE